MLTRRDQVQAYRFAQNRVQTALLSGQPDRTDLPMRRQRFAAFVGVMVAVLLVCGFGIWGLLRPGGKEGWRERDTLVVERETGARYVYDPADGALHPVLNYASARLILNAPQVAVRQFSRDSLAGAPRGAARGLPGLPDAVPGPEGLMRGPWSMCSGSADGPPWSTLSLGVVPGGRRLDPGHALLVEVPDGRNYLVWNDTRLEVTRPFALNALGLGGARPLRVTDDWLDAALAPGPDLAPPGVPGLGRPAPYPVAGEEVRVGQVQQVAAAGGIGTRYYLALADGLAPVHDATALLLLGDPELSAAYGGRAPQPVPRAAADISAAPQSATRVTPEGFPETVPKLLQPTPADDGTSVVCGTYTDTTGRSMTSSVYVGAAVAAPAGAPGSRRRAQVPPGRAAVVRLLPHARVPTDSLFLVTDSGLKYPVPAPEVLRTLGLGDVEAVPLPAGMAGAIPTGPALDPARVNADVPFPTPTTDGVPTGAATVSSAPPAPRATVTRTVTRRPTPTRKRPATSASARPTSPATQEQGEG